MKKTVKTKVQITSEPLVSKRRGRPSKKLESQKNLKEIKKEISKEVTSQKESPKKPPTSDETPKDPITLELEKINPFEPKLDPETESQTVLKEIDKRGIFYRAWKPEILKEVGEVTKELIGQPIRVAEDPKNKTYILKEIKAVGSPGFKHGALVISDPAYIYPISLFLDQASAFPKKKKVSNSQLSLKKKSA